MALSTRSIIEWAGAVRSILGMGGETPTRDTRGHDREMDVDVPIKEEPTDDEQQAHLATIQRHSETSSSAGYQTQDDDSDVVEMVQISMEERMEMAKKRFPGAKNWARDEERLFEILFLRQDLPMMPSHWSFDFRGVPLTERVFETSQKYPPVIYACGKDGMTDFKATTSITRLIDLTLAVRTLLQSSEARTPEEQRRKRQRAATIIKDRLDEFLHWAARDGGYDKLKYVPNVTVEIIEVPEVQSQIVDWMTARMTALVRLQQEWLREDRDDDFWTLAYPALMGSTAKKKKRGRYERTGWWSSEKKKRKRGTEMPQTPDLTHTTASPDTTATPRASGFGSSKRQLFKKRKVSLGEQNTALGDDTSDRLTPASIRDPVIIKKESPDGDDDVTPRAFSRATQKVMSDVNTPIKPRSSSALEEKTTPTSHGTYRRKPPVVYGFFILGTSVLVLTADASRGSSAYVSFHLDISFADSHQSVWNALTIAAIVCRARDELITRVDDFEPVPQLEESDPDA